VDPEDSELPLSEDPLILESASRDEARDDSEDFKLSVSPDDEPHESHTTVVVFVVVRASFR
jgi:hypothetical protein